LTGGVNSSLEDIIHQTHRIASIDEESLDAGAERTGGRFRVGAGARPEHPKIKFVIKPEKAAVHGFQRIGYFDLRVSRCVFRRKGIGEARFTSDRIVSRAGGGGGVLRSGKTEVETETASD